MLLAVRLAENKDVLTPVFVCQDGFITSHCYEAVEFLDDETVRDFVGVRTAQYPLLMWIILCPTVLLPCLNITFKSSVTRWRGMNNVPRVYQELSQELESHTGRKYAPVDAYRGLTMRTIW